MKALRNLFSPDRHATVKAKLNLMSRRGPIYDFKEIMNTGGKVWPEASELISTMEAKEIPKDWIIDGRTAHSLFAENKKTLLAVSYAAFSDAHVSSFLSSHPLLPRLLFRPILNPLKWLLWSKLIPSTPNSHVLRGDLPSAEGVFQMYNKAAGYVFLIDQHGLIRWKASGPATESELKTLNNIINLFP